MITNISLVSENNTSQHDIFFSPDNLTSINQDFPWTRTNLAIFITNNVTVVSVNLLVLVWLKLKENRAVNEPSRSFTLPLKQCFHNSEYLRKIFFRKIS